MKKLFVIAVAVMLPLLTFAGRAKVLKIDFKNPIAERKTGGSSLDIKSLINGGPSSVTLLSYVQAIDAAAEDKNNLISHRCQIIRSVAEIFTVSHNRFAGFSETVQSGTDLLHLRQSG